MPQKHRWPLKHSQVNMANMATQTQIIRKTVPMTMAIVIQIRIKTVPMTMITTIPIPSVKTVRNISKTPLTEARECLLAHMPNFVIVPKESPICEYIAATEKTGQQLMQGKVEELRGNIKSILKKKPNTKPNISKEEYQALKHMKKDNTRMVLTADKGISMVVMDKEEYIQKSEELLQQTTYKILTIDPTTKHKNNLISLRKSIKAEGGINENTYRRLYPTGLDHQNIMGYPRCIRKACH